MTTQVSLSQINLFRECEQAYYYRYVLKLQKKGGAVQLERGKLLHDYMARYYTKIAEKSPDEAHEEARAEVVAKWVPDIDDLVMLAISLGGDAGDMGGMVDTAMYLIDRYFVVHGRADADRFEVLHVETSLLVRLSKGLNSLGYADMVTRDKSTGLVYLWEHKSHKKIPSMGYRMRDLQTLLYRAKLRTLDIANPDAVMWNYIRTAPPAVPSVNKDGTLEKRKNIDSTWDVYRTAVIDNGEDPKDYEGMRLILEGKEEEKFFPRFEHRIAAEESVLLRDYVTTSQDIVRLKREWASGKRVPVRHIGYNCDFCEFNKACMGVILTGGDDAIIREYFTTPEQRALQI